MSFLITPSTEIEAVNECLENIGQAPVSTISGSLGVDTQIALNFVRKINRELQSRGWYWNTEEDYVIEPNGAGDLLLPATTLSVSVVQEDYDNFIVARGRRLYDRKNHTYTFSKSVKVHLIVGLTFEELQEPARRYIALKAARQFQDRIEGSADQGDTQDEMMAMAILQEDQIRVEGSNMLNDNYSILSTLRRHAYGYSR